MDGQKIFVSTVGDDSGDGSEEEPLRTLEKAIDVANEMREDSDKLIEILLREGTYSVTNTIKIINSQKDDPLLKISAYQDEKVTINAGVDIPLSAMSIADSDFTNAIIDKPNAGSVLQYNLKDAQIEDLGEISLRGHLISDEKEAQAELSLNGEVQKLAGWPNGEYTGLIKPTDSNEYGKRTKSGIANGCSFQVNYDRPSQWSKPEQAWLSGTIGPNYEFDYYPVSRFDSEEKRVYLSRGALEKYYTEPYYRFENVPEELDEPGEYYIDRQSGMLYFYPPEDTPKDSVLTITMSTPTLDVSGKAPNSMFRIENSKNIVFENLIFKGGRGSAITGKNNSNINSLIVK